ncbi:MAG TPA: PQQ-binding-like beta-propeller repeat protein, partial [Pirellulaceae bacterium]|nr:PQQ-binding-like beta-propeller repeat protein [Pirellulaceae bacterium]
DAARLVTSLDPEAAPGVAPYVNDKALLTSLPVAVQLTLGEFPQLRQSLGDRFAALARLRIGQAIAAGDAATIELATVQFAGTDAAAEAHQWLGDRALAGGAFTRAILEYTRAGQSDASLASGISPRIRLAAAMLGRDEQAAVTRPVRFGELALSAAEFEALVTEMRSRGQSSALAVSPQITAARAAPAPSGFDVHVRSKLDGPTGDRPQEEVGRRTNQYRVPWADRQIATAVEGDTLYVANRFQVAAYNLADGQRKWQSQNPPGSMARAQDWAMIPMQPLITGDRIFVRLLYSSNPLLVCLEKSTGKLLWVAENRDREYLVSDPHLVQGQLVALGVQIQQEQQGQLRWCQFDPQTGEMLKQRDLVRLRNTWGTRSCCEIAPLDDGLVAALGGLTLAVDAAGNIRWVRTHVTLPADEDPRWVLQSYQPPLIQGDRLYVAQPGARTVECLSAASGRKFWSAVLPEVIGIAGLSGNRLIVRTEAGLRALDVADGKTLWRYAASELYSFPLVDEKSLLVASRERVVNQNDKWQVRLTWLDPATGQPAATTVLAKLSESDPRLGPLVPYKDRLFTFFGRGQHDPVREVVELVPKGKADRPPPIEAASDPWRQRLPGELTQAAWELLGDWQLISAQGGDRTGRVAEVHGERDVLGLRASGAWPVVLARELTIPKQGRPRLRLKLGNDGGQLWKLEVRHGERLLKTEEFKDETHKDRWKTLEIDLTPAAGHAGWLTIDARSANGDHVLWWKDAEVLF